MGFLIRNAFVEPFAATCKNTAIEADLLREVAEVYKRMPPLKPCKP